MAAEEDGIEFKARMTNAQFGALAHHLRTSELLPDIAALGKSRFKRVGIFDQADSKKLLRNAWNTERLLRFQSEEMPREFQQYALQWAFPQAYYACFNQLQAFYRAIGRRESSHAASMKLFGRFCKEGRYPARIAFLALGGKTAITFCRVKHHPTQPSYRWDYDARTTESIIAGFLKSTREDQLDERREKMANDFVTKGPKPRLKQRLSAKDWERVSEAIGYTSLLHLLYRKRIKSNYRDILTFLADEIQGPSILQGLVQIVEAFSTVHEYLMASILTPERYEQIGLEHIEHAPARKRLEDWIHPLLKGETPLVNDPWSYRNKATAEF